MYMGAYMAHTCPTPLGTNPCQGNNALFRSADPMSKTAQASTWGRCAYMLRSACGKGGWRGMERAARGRGMVDSWGEWMIQEGGWVSPRACP